MTVPGCIIKWKLHSVYMKPSWNTNFILWLECNQHPLEILMNTLYHQLIFTSINFPLLSSSLPPFFSLWKYTGSTVSLFSHHLIHCRYFNYWAVSSYFLLLIHCTIHDPSSFKSTNPAVSVEISKLYKLMCLIL